MSFETGPASPALPGVACAGLLDGSGQKECGREYVVAGEDLRGPPFVSSINNIVPGVNRSFDSRRAFNTSLRAWCQEAQGLSWPVNEFLLIC